MTDAELITRLSEDNERLRQALRRLIYEITHLSPMEDDGSHRCKVSAGALKEARAALAQGQKEGGVMNRVEYDEEGYLDEVVTDAGMHLERMSDDGWFLAGQRLDGSQVVVYLTAKIHLVEEWPAQTEGGADG